jgi:hypothetical protein
MNVLAMLLGPVSSATPGGGDPWFTWIAIGVAGVVLVTAWIKYLSRDPETKVPLQNLLWVSGICSAIIIVSVIELLHK